MFLFDIGVRNALLRRPLDRPLDDEKGLLLEHLVALELYQRLGSFWPGASLYHYRTRHGVEVDFVLSLERETWGIEVKSSRRVHTSMLRGLKGLSYRNPQVTRKILVFLGPRRQIVDDVEVLPLEDFLDLLPG